MKSFFAIGTPLLGLASSVVNAAAVPVERLLATRNETSEAFDDHQSSISCLKSGGNGPNSRQCWTPGFDSSTNMYTSWPKTGRVVPYDLHIKNTTCSPDGSHPRPCMLINGQYPGPTIEANWGDTIRVTVHNDLIHNGTSMHWHGMRLLNSNIQDGTNGITECALAAGDTKMYQFQATEYGTSWYHSHFSDQYGDGVLGAIQINGPATANYDIDLGPMPISDWYYLTAFQANSIAFQDFQLIETPGSPRPDKSDNTLINGMAKSANGTGAYSKVTLQKGKRHRLRLINTSVDANYVINLDGHNLTVIATDFVPVKPYNTSSISIGIGQRYDVIITADQKSDNYWFHARADGSCQSGVKKDGMAIFSYNNAKAGEPATVTLPALPTSCTDPITTPKISISVPSSTFAAQVQTLPVTAGHVAVQDNLILWTINGTSMKIDPGKPTLGFVSDRQKIPDAYNTIELNTKGDDSWTYWIIQQAPGAPPLGHPIHLHGHDAFILGQGLGTFSAQDNFKDLRFDNPPRRDVMQLQARGWLVIAFLTDNPGAWLMHCHIASHVGEGFSLQFLERKKDIKQLPRPGSDWDRTCRNWAAYKAGKTDIYEQSDSGL